MALCEKILLAGFSGAGKTSFLRELESSAPEKWILFDDLDQLILKQHGKQDSDLASMIEREGWEKFRLWERQLLDGWLKEEGRGVLALGGGTLHPNLIQILSPIKKIRILHLQCDFETCWSRLRGETEVRPLVLRGKQEFKKIFESRAEIFQMIPWRMDNSASTDLSLLAQKFWKEVSPS